MNNLQFTCQIFIYCLFLVSLSQYVVLLSGLKGITLSQKIKLQVTIQLQDGLIVRQYKVEKTYQYDPSFGFHQTFILNFYQFFLTPNLINLKHREVTYYVLKLIKRIQNKSKKYFRVWMNTYSKYHLRFKKNLKNYEDHDFKVSQKPIFLSSFPNLLNFLLKYYHIVFLNVLSVLI